MAEKRKTIAIQYRRFDNGSTSNGKTLEDNVREALTSTVDGHRLLDRFALRIWRRNGDDNLFSNVVHNDSSPESHCMFGDIIHFTHGHLQALFDAGQREAPQADVRQMPAQGHNEFIHSLMYWLIINDHVFIIQSQTLKTDAAEGYLNWLLSNRTSTLLPSTPVVLSSRFDAEAVGGDLDDIKELVIGGSVASQSRSEEGVEIVTEEVSQKTILDTVTEKCANWKEFLGHLVGGSANVEQILNAVPPEAELSVQVRIGFKTKKKRVSRAALRDLEIGLRNIPDSQLQVRAKNGTKATDGSIRLHHNASIKLKTVDDGTERRAGSLLDPDDVLRAMKEAYGIFLANGKISEEN